MSFIKIIALSFLLTTAYPYDACVKTFDDAKANKTKIQKPRAFMKQCLDVVDTIKEDQNKLEKILTIAMDLYTDHRLLHYVEKGGMIISVGGKVIKDPRKLTPQQEDYLNGVSKIIVYLDCMGKKVDYNMLFTKVANSQFKSAEAVLSEENKALYIRNREWLDLFYWVASHRETIVSADNKDEDGEYEDVNVIFTKAIDRHPLSFGASIVSNSTRLGNFLSHVKFFKRYFSCFGIDYQSRDPIVEFSVYKTLPDKLSYETLKGLIQDFEKLGTRDRASALVRAALIQKASQDKDWPAKKEELKKEIDKFHITKGSDTVNFIRDYLDGKRLTLT